MITAILEDPAPHASQVYPLFGAKEMNHYEIAEEISKALGKPVTYMPISLDEFTDRLRKRGSHEQLIQHARAVAIDYRNGVFAGTNEIVETVGGRDPQTVQEFVTRNKKYYDNKSTITFT